MPLSWYSRLAATMARTSARGRYPVTPWRVRRWRPRLETLEARLVLFDHTWSHGTCIICTDQLWSDEENWSNGSPAGDPDPEGAVVVFPEDAGSGWDHNFDDIPGVLPVKSLYYHRGGFLTDAVSGDSLLLSENIFNELGSINTVQPDIRFVDQGNLGQHQIGVSDDGILELLGNLTGGGGAILTKSGTGTLRLSGNNQNFTGTLDIDEGTVQLGSSTALTNSTAFIQQLVAGSTLDLNNFDAAANFLGIDASSFVGNIRLGSGTLTFGSSSSADLEGSISGSGGLTVDGPGAQVTLGAHGTFTYTGQTLVNAGTLWVDATLPNDPITLLAGGTLSGGGTVGAVTVRGGLLHPGSGGTHGSNLVSQGNVLFEPGSSFEADIRGRAVNQYDSLIATGTIDLSNGETTLMINGGVNSAEGDTFTILHSSTGIVGHFAGLPDGAVFRGADHRLYRVNYTSTDVVVTHLPQFLPPAYYPLGQTVNPNTAHTIVAGDLNGDGIPDLVVTSSSGAVRILLGNGDGTFQTQPPIILPMAAIAVTTGHFHDPNILDLAVTVSDPVAGGFVDILLGNGDGTFQAPVSYAVGQAPYDIEAGDLNGDGFDDLVVFNVGDNDLGVLYNNGDGTFQAPQTFSFPNYRIGAFTLGAVNDDGLLDIIVGNNSGFQGSDSVISVLTNQGNDANGHASFRHDPMLDDYRTNSVISSLAVGDFNNDGIPDVLWVDEGGGRVGVYQGSAVGGFQGMPIFSSILGPSGTLTGAVAIGDFIGDGNLGVTLIADGTTEVVMYGKGDGTFGPACSYTVNSGDASRVHALVAADFNGDGAIDLAALTVSSSTTLGSVATLLNTGTGIPPAPHPGRRPPRLASEPVDATSAPFLDPAVSDGFAAAAFMAAPGATPAPALSPTTVSPADQLFALIGPADLAPPVSHGRLLARPALYSPFAWETTSQAWLAEEMLPDRLAR